MCRAGLSVFKAKRYNNRKIMKDIMEATPPLEIKHAGADVITDENWEKEIFHAMEELLLDRTNIIFPSYEHQAF